MDSKKPKLRWTPEIEGYIRIEHNVRRETVSGKCYRLVVVELVDKKAWILEPVTGYRYAAGDPKKGSVK